jgi:arginine/lysine/ornithine decarboxylase
MKKINRNEPLNKFLESNRKRKPVSFHMPGHKYGRFPYQSIQGGFAAYDITEIPGADNIQRAEGIISDSLDMISKSYGSDKTFFLTNGATAGILSIIKYFSNIGGSVLVSRDCHSSVVNGAVLFGVPIEFMPIGSMNGIPRPVTAQAVKTAVEASKTCKAVIITSPNYYGLTANLEEISGYLKSRNILLAVDEAHGAHFAFCGLHELSGLGNKADIVIHSLHKTMPVYNQGALIHVKGDAVNCNELYKIVAMLGTSSPSYPIMASMEKAVFHYRQHGRTMYRKLAAIVGKSVINITAMGFDFLVNDDFSRLVIDVSSMNNNGYRVFEKLSKMGVVMESCDSRNLIAITSPSNQRSDFLKLERALESISRDSTGIGKTVIRDMQWTIPEKAMDIQKAVLTKKCLLPMDRAEGSICGTIIVPYPPGIPCLYPGEVITGETTLQLKHIVEEGGVVLGLDRGMIPVLELA